MNDTDLGVPAILRGVVVAVAVALTGVAIFQGEGEGDDDIESPWRAEASSSSIFIFLGVLDLGVALGVDLGVLGSLGLTRQCQSD